MAVEPVTGPRSAGNAWRFSPDAGEAVAPALAAAPAAAAAPRAATYTLDGVAVTADANVIALGPDGSLAVTLAGLARDDGGRLISARQATRTAVAVTALVSGYNLARRSLDAHVDLFPLTTAALRALGARFRPALASVGFVPTPAGGPEPPPILDRFG